MFEAATSDPDGSPPIARITLPTCRAHYPDGPRWVHMSIASPSTRPSPLFRRVGIHTFTFEACSGFTHVTARRIAQPPKATFVTRLQPMRLPAQAARQLPDQSTTLRVESSSTDNPRLRGALPIADIVGRPLGNAECHSRPKCAAPNGGLARRHTRALRALSTRPFIQSAKRSTGLDSKCAYAFSRKIGKGQRILLRGQSNASQPRGTF